MAEAPRKIGERVARRVTYDRHPADNDELLLMTTRARESR